MKKTTKRKSKPKQVFFRVDPLCPKNQVTIVDEEKFGLRNTKWGIPKLDCPYAKEYTPLRRFYAWTGFLAIAIALIWAVYAMFTMERVITIVAEDYGSQEAFLELQTVEGSSDIESLSVTITIREEVPAEVSAYTSDPAETDDSPFITASNTRVRPGIVANNCLEFGTKVVIDGTEYEVMDRMNRRYSCQHFDIWMEEKTDALEWGRQSKNVIIINDHE